MCGGPRNRTSDISKMTGLQRDGALCDNPLLTILYLDSVYKTLASLIINTLHNLLWVLQCFFFFVVLHSAIIALVAPINNPALTILEAKLIFVLNTITIV